MIPSPQYEFKNYHLKSTCGDHGRIIALVDGDIIKRELSSPNTFESDSMRNSVRLSSVNSLFTTAYMAAAISLLLILAKKPSLPKFIPITGTPELRMMVTISSMVPSPPRVKNNIDKTFYLVAFRAAGCILRCVSSPAKSSYSMW
jgi:hypothetical protein